MWRERTRWAAHRSREAPRRGHAPTGEPSGGGGKPITINSGFVGASQIVTSDAKARVVSMEIFSQGDVSYYLIFLSPVNDNLKLPVPFVWGLGGL